MRGPSSKVMPSVLGAAAGQSGRGEGWGGGFLVSRCLALVDAAVPEPCFTHGGGQDRSFGATGGGWGAGPGHGHPVGHGTGGPGETWPSIGTLYVEREVQKVKLKIILVSMNMFILVW